VSTEPTALGEGPTTLGREPATQAQEPAALGQQAAAGSGSRSSLTPPAAVLGRDEELQALLRLLEPGGPAVINVTGARGMGKSALVRAALDVAAPRFADVQTLDLTGETTATALSGLRRHLSRMPIVLHRGAPEAAGERTLLYLDRADLLARAGGELNELASSHGALVVVLESVQQVRAADCHLLLVGPLSTAAAIEHFRRTAESAGLRLAEDRASTAYIQRICTAVEGNPLAIELAAARLAFMPLSSLATRLEAPGRALSVLTSPASEGTTALRTALEDSHRATSEDAQLLLDLLSVFSGSFSLEAIEAVCAGEVPACFDALGELLDLRLVELDPTVGEGRYRLSRLVRDFAFERLRTSSREAAARGRHAAHHAGVARRAACAFDDADEEEARAILGDDYAEALAALGWLTQADPVTALRLAADLGWEGHRRGGGTVLVSALEHLTSHVADAGARAARRDALLWLAQLASWSPVVGDQAELIGRRLAEGLTLAHELGEPLPLLRGLRTQLLAVTAHGDVRSAVAACAEGIEVASALGHARWLGRFEISSSAMYGVLQQFEVAAPLAASGLARATRSGDRRGIALGSLALHVMPPDYVPDRASLPPLESVLEIFQELGDLQNEVHTLATLAHQAIERGDPRTAATWVLARRDRLGKTDLLNGLTVSVMLAVRISRLRGDHALSARLHGSVAAHMEPLLAIMSPTDVERYRAGLEASRAELGPETFDEQVASGRLLDRDETAVELVRYLRDVVDEEAAPVVRAGPSAASAALTAREEQVLALLGRGLRNKEIAAELGITPKSVMHHTVSIYRRLGVRSRTEAVTTATRAGLLPRE
jgi:DNA-binding CsgD family transcriptional regulator/predicted ATPase